MVGAPDNSGFYSIDFARLASSYETAKGFVFKIPVEVFTPVTGSPVDMTLEFQLNQANGNLLANLDLSDGGL